MSKVSIFAAAVVMAAAGGAIAQDDAAKKANRFQQSNRFRIVVDGDDQPGVARILRLPHNDSHASKYWIGVMATPVGDTLKAQLRLETGLAVDQVVDDGPAKKAGVKSHDILLKFNGKQLTDVASLIKAVDASKGKKADLVLLRGGSEKKVSVTPKERPAVDHPLTLDLNNKNIESWLMRGPNNRMMFFGPGMRLAPGQKLKDLNIELELHDDAGDGKKQMSMTIKRENDKPAKIIVKKDGKTYEVDEKSLDELPEDIQEIVKKHLKGAHGNTWRHMQWTRPKLHLNLPHAPHLPHGAPNAPKLPHFGPGHEHFEKQMQKMMERMEKLIEEVEQLKERRRAPRKREGETVDA